MVVVLEEDLGIVMLPILVYQVQVVLKAVVEILADPKLVLTIQEILMPHLHQLSDGDMQAHLVQVLMRVVAVAVALVVQVDHPHKVDLVFNCHLHLGIQMDSNMINIQIIHLDLVQTPGWWVAGGGSGTVYTPGPTPYSSLILEWVYRGGGSRNPADPRYPFYGFNGMANTGGGGCGGSPINTAGFGSSGGSGVVIVAYPT